ncbi:MAG: hypothetical protein IT352_12525 [Gemmatimonadales bacterium]|nr:hypothetical protein [Gemmatimonadales bacterium]
MTDPNLGLDELMIVNPGPVGARPCRLAPLTPVAGGPLGCGCEGGPRPGTLHLGDDGIVYRAVGRAVPARPRARPDQR